MGTATEAIRRRAIEAYASGVGTQAQVAVMYRVTLRTFVRWWRRYQQHGTFAPAAKGHRKAVYEGSDLAALERVLKQCPDATLEQLREQTGKDCSIMAVHRALRRLDWRRKKSRSTPASKAGPMCSKPARRGNNRRPRSLRNA